MDTALSVIDKLVISLYPEISDEGHKLFTSLLVKKELQKGERLFDEGDICRELVFVASGMLRQFYFKNGHDITEHFSYEGSVLICIESFFKQEPTRLLAEALEPSEVYLLPYSKLRPQLASSWDIDSLYRRILEDSLITSQQKADSMRYESASDRYNKLLETQPEVVQRAPLSYIASYLLMTPETLSRVRAQLTNKS
jgi:CRP-like cAMP-binding protein